MFLKKVSMQPDFLDRIEPVPADEPLTITSAVGDGFPPRCRNLAPDVKKIQAALNRFSPLDGGPIEKLVVDGIAGRLTKEAIHRFQRKFGIKVRNTNVDDGIVDIDGPTIQRLRAGPDVLIPDAPGLFMSEIPRVIGIVTAAQGALSLAQAQLDLPNPLGGSVSGLEKHFHAKTNAERRSTIQLAQKVYTRIQAAIGHIPVGRVLALDEPPKTEVRSFMFTFAGGFNLPFDPKTKRVPQWEGLDVDRIYVTPKGRTMTTEQFRYAMIHELAHFVSDTDGMPAIEDFAYFHRQRAKYDALNNFFSVRNADCYSRFAFEAIGRGDLPLLP
jgi:peptidoglycan hydrolase-like protein with peptidoglycan-binding domain